MGRSDLAVYQEQFDGRGFLDTFYKPDVFKFPDRFPGNMITSITSNMHSIMKTNGLKGKKVLDFGCGPVMHYSIGASRHYSEIFYADFENSLQEVYKWIEHQPDRFDWSHFFQRYASLERRTPETLEKRLRNKIRGTLTLTDSLLVDDPLDAKYYNQFDLILVMHCLKAACDNMDDYTLGLKQLKKYLAPAGHILVLEELGEHYNEVEGETLHMLSLKGDDVVMSFKEAGLLVVESVQESYKNKEMKISDSCKYHLTLGRKP